jgi:hypothetical protein
MSCCLLRKSSRKQWETFERDLKRYCCLRLVQDLKSSFKIQRFNSQKIHWTCSWSFKRANFLFNSWLTENSSWKCVENKPKRNTCIWFKFGIID